MEVQNLTLRAVLEELSNRWGIELLNRRTGEMNIDYVLFLNGSVCRQKELDTELTDEREVEIIFVSMMAGGWINTPTQELEVEAREILSPI